MKCPICPEPIKWTTSALSPDGRCKYCGSELEPVRWVSFVDCPGHEMLMSTMLSGATVMDSALLVIDATVPCPQPQTREHFKALEITDVKDIIIVQNKVEIAGREKAIENYRQIKEFLRGTFAEKSPIIPVSALHKVNIDLLIEAIQKYMPNPIRDESKTPLMHIIRSFNINRPGISIEKMKGGILGGTIIQGILRIGDEIEILPGARVRMGGKGRGIRFIPLRTVITGLMSGEIKLDIARPGGLIGVATKLDPAITKSDNMIGNVAGLPGELPDPINNITIKYELFEEVVGLSKPIKVEAPRVGEELIISVGPARTIGIVTSVKSDKMSLKLGLPVVAFSGSKVAISRKIMNRWRLIGHGVIE